MGLCLECGKCGWAATPALRERQLSWGEEGDALACAYAGLVAEECLPLGEASCTDGASTGANEKEGWKADSLPMSISTETWPVVALLVSTFEL